MPTINELSATDSLSVADQIAIWQTNNGDTRKASLNTLLDFIKQNSEYSVLNTLSDLKNVAVDSYRLYQILGKTTINDNEGGSFYWDPNSVELADDFLIVESNNTSTGRWLRLRTSSIYVVDTIADLPTNPNEDDVCEVRDLDRGGIFIFKASEVSNNNGGTNINGWLRQYYGTVNAKWFGAVGDGVVDDTLAIQSALDCPEYSIMLPKGTYLISANLSMNSKKLQGESATIKLATINIGAISVDGSNNTIENITIDGQAGLNTFSNNGLHFGIKFNDYTSSSNMVRGCTFKNLQFIGVQLKSKASTVKDSYFENCGYGGVFTANRFNMIEDNTFISCANSTTPYDGAVISDTYYELDGYNMRTGLNDRAIISGNTISTSKQVGIDSHSGSELNISNNIVNNCDLDGIYLHRTSYVTEGLLDTDGRIDRCIVSNNNIYACLSGITFSSFEASDALDRIACTNNTVVGNNISDCTDTGISLGRGCFRNTVKANTIEGNPVGISVFYWSDNNVIRENHVTNFESFGIRIQPSASTYYCDNNIVEDNSFNCSTGVAIFNRIGARYTNIKTNEFIGRTTFFPIVDEEALSTRQALIIHKQRAFTFANASVTDMVGETIKNLAPVAGGYIGWVCITAGDTVSTNGVWKEYGSIVP